MAKPNLLVISHVLPFPANSGQSQRVYYTLRAVREHFHITFLTISTPEKSTELKKTLATFVDEVIILPSITQSSMLKKVYHKVMGKIYSGVTGLKESNYTIGEVEFSPARLEKVIGNKKFELVLFEYFHAYKATEVFSKRYIPVILDTHNILWQTYIEHVLKKQNRPSFIKDIYLKKYRRIEEYAWDKFDYVIAINRNEFQYMSSTVKLAKVIYMPMGIDLANWQYGFSPTQPPRLAYYGGLGSAHNQKSALICAEKIMPLVWEKYPGAELWIIGTKPPEHIKALARDKRIHVTGFVEKASDALNPISVVLCPWEGKYGFRSRIVEVMALGVPMITSFDAVDGMDFTNGHGIFLTDSINEMASIALSLLDNPEKLLQQSHQANEAVNNMYSYEATYVAAIDGLCKELGL